jgi:phosphoribosylformimino-5-aminoimidazole carboxamide ribotide isomerase
VVRGQLTGPPRDAGIVGGVFRPCIDLHDGRVKQIVGGTLGDHGALRTNFVADHGAEWFAARYRDDGLRGGHVIKLGPGNDEAAHAALDAYPGGLQLGGGVDDTNARSWLDVGASHVIVTSWLFPGSSLADDRLDSLIAAVGRERVVIDLSCRPFGGEYVVMAGRWQRRTDFVLGPASLDALGARCAELLVHAVDVEGLSQGIDADLVARLAEWAPMPVTYAGGARSLDDLELVDEIGAGRVDLTIGSALDLFGGTGVRYDDVVAFNRARIAARGSEAGG